MRNVSMIVLVFLVASFCVFETQSASAQTNTCVLRLNVSTTNKQFEIRPVNGARATALNTSSHKSISTVSVLGTPTFLKLRDGEYRITVTKLGFKRAIQPLSFTCERMNAWTTLQVELTPGNSRRSVVATAESIYANNTNIPPVRRGVTTIIGTSDRSAPSDPSAGNGVENQDTPPSLPNVIHGGVLNGKALVLARPAYPPLAQQAHVSGVVTVQVVIDVEGNVISAHAISGHPLLKAASEEAARSSRFSPTKLSGQPVKVTGVITYNFMAE